ncbi:MAG: TonB-dependent receptor, partial [Myxococcota bacterium]
MIEVADLPVSAELADAIERAPGVVVRRLGGVGDLAQVGIRGASARQSEILLDGLPLNPEGGSAVNLAEWPVRAFERVEVYRGAAPALLGTTALGGAVALIPSTGPVSELTLAGGSYGTRRATATAGVDTGAGYVLANVDGLWTDGAFRYWDDRGTAFNLDDDRVAVRGNNDTAQGSGLVELRGRGGPVEWVGLYAGLTRDEGVPGFTFAPSPTVRYHVTRHLAGARFAAPVGGLELGGRGFALARAEALSDPLGEIGVGAQQTDDHSTSLGSDLTARAPVAVWARLDLGVGARVDRFRSAGDGERRRWIGKAVLAAPLGRPARGIEPMVQLLAVSGQPARVLPRLGATTRTGAVGWRANVGGFARPPDLVELYGDRGALVGNPDLRAERGVQADLGGRAGGFDAVGFVAGYRDLIAWTVGAQGVARPENVDRADVFGVELAVDRSAGRWRFGGSATATRAVD